MSYPEYIIIYIYIVLCICNSNIIQFLHNRLRIHAGGLAFTMAMPNTKKFRLLAVPVKES